MFKLTIKKQDDSVYWTEDFNTLPELNAWLNEEMTRPYWDENFTHEIADISETLTIDPNASKIAKFTNRTMFGNILRAEIAVINESKRWTTSDVIAYMTNPVIQQIDALIGSMSLGSASSLIKATDLSAYYTVEQKTYISDLIDNYLESE